MKNGDPNTCWLIIHRETKKILAVRPANSFDEAWSRVTLAQRKQLEERGWRATKCRVDPEIIKEMG